VWWLRIVYKPENHLLKVRGVTLDQKANDESKKAKDGAEDFNDEDLDESITVSA
jgi:hypothetical protein